MNFALIPEKIENPDINYEGNNDAKMAARMFVEQFPKFIVTVYKETSEWDGFYHYRLFSSKEQEVEKKKIVSKQQHYC